MLNDLVRLQLTFRQTVIKFIIIKLSNIFNIIELYNIDNYKISTLTVPRYEFKTRTRQLLPSTIS